MKVLFKVTDVKKKKTQFVTWKLLHVPSPHRDSHEDTTESTRESYNATRTKMQFLFTYEYKKNGLINHKLHSANQNWSYLSMNLLHHHQFCKLSNWKANSCAALF